MSRVAYCFITAIYPSPYYIITQSAASVLAAHRRQLGVWRRELHGGHQTHVGTGAFPPLLLDDRLEVPHPHQCLRK